MTPVVSEAAMMRLVTSINGNAVNDFAVVRRVRLCINSDKFVRAITETFNAKCPDIDELLLAVDPSEVW